MSYTSRSQGLPGSTGAQGPIGTNLGVYMHYPVSNTVVEQDIVMSLINKGNGQSPLYFTQAVNGGNSYYPAIYGVAKNVSGGFADIYIGKNIVIPGFSFGVFIGVDYYIDPANPGKLTWTPPATGSSVNPIKIGRSLDATNLILDPIGNFIQLKGALVVSDGSYDDTLSPGANGSILSADSTQTYGLKWIASPFATPVFTGNVTASTGNILISTLGKGVQVKTGTNSKIGTAVLVAGTVTVANTSVTANSRIILTSQTDGGTPGFLRVSAKTIGTSFVIKSSSTTDTSTVAWYIVESIP